MDKLLFYIFVSLMQYFFTVSCRSKFIIERVILTKMHFKII